MTRGFFALLALPLCLFVGASSEPVSAQTLISIDVTANRKPINPLVYGSAFPTAAQVADLNCPISRFGGNEASSYNWQANAAGKGADWYFESWVNDTSSVPGEAVDSFVSAVKTGGGLPILTLPMLNYLGIVGSNRETLWSYSVAKYGAQTGADPFNADAGNGISVAAGHPLIQNDPTDANTANSLGLQKAWLTHILTTWGASNAGGVKYYVMDNEPSIWHSSHQDVHPVGETYTELYNDYVAYAGAVRAADPNALIAGPEEWGWSGYFYSGYDQQYGAAHDWNGTFPDRASHGNMDHIPWLLQSLKQYQATTGTRLLDILSVHYYPQQSEFSNDDSSDTQAERNRSTRSLWDPNYVDTSWIGSTVMLIPRLKSWVSTYYPGLQTAITEYNWGDEGAMNGATAQADIFGIFGREGLDIANRWTTPATNSPAYLAMKIYRNYDGSKSTFGDTSVSCDAPDPDFVSAFAAQRSKDGALTIMLVNKLTTASSVQVDVKGFAPQDVASAWQLAPAKAPQTPLIARLPNTNVAASGFNLTLPAQSVTLYVLTPATSNSIAAVSVSPSTVTGASGSTGSVTLASAAPTGGWSVNLSSSSSAYVGVPPTVTVPAGSKSITFPITTKPYVETYTKIVTAADSQSSKSAALTVLDDSLYSVTLSPTSVVGGSTSTGTVSLLAPAPAGGWTVNLASSTPSYVGVPASVTIAAGSRSATFPITTKAAVQTYTQTITASDPESTRSAVLTVLDDSISNLAVSPSSVVGGHTSTGTVSLLAPAPVGGWVVNLAKSNSAFVSVPNTVTVPAGLSTATFTITTKPYPAKYSKEIAASDALSMKSVILTVTPT